MSRRLTGAFSLAEIITVIAILLILMAICGFAFGPSLYKAKTQPICASNLKQIATAYVMYSTDNDGGFPMIGGLSSHPYLAKQYHLVTRCPLNPQSEYEDMYSWALGLGGLRPNSPPRTSEIFPDGTSIPHFDSSLDVIVRCLDHGFDGFDRHGSRVFSIEGSTGGKVLGARLDTSVTRVFPLSCWEFGSWPKKQIAIYPGLWGHCDRPARG
jgi:hypothetical protein